MSFKRSFSLEGMTFYHSRNDEPDTDSFGRHCHLNYELLYVAEGQGEYVIEGGSHPLIPGSAILLKPYQYHYVQPRSDRAYERYVVNFRSELLYEPALSLDLLCGDGDSKHYFSALGCRFELAALFSSFERMAASVPEDRPLLQGSLRAVMTQALLLLSRESADTRTGDGGTVAHLVEYLNRNITNDLSLDLLSRELYVSKYHLCRKFRERVGVSVFEYVATKRCALAREYISRRMTATAAAEAVGYRDYSSFYRAYVKHMGCAPTDRPEN